MSDLFDPPTEPVDILAAHNLHIVYVMLEQIRNSSRATHGDNYLERMSELMDVPPEDIDAALDGRIDITMSDLMDLALAGCAKLELSAEEYGQVWQRYSP